MTDRLNIRLRGMNTSDIDRLAEMSGYGDRSEYVRELIRKDARSKGLIGAE